MADTLARAGDGARGAGYDVSGGCLGIARSGAAAGACATGALPGAGGGDVAGGGLEPVGAVAQRLG